MICTRLRPGHLNVHVGDGLRRGEEIVKKSRIAPLNAINIVVVVVVVVVVTIIISLSSSSSSSLLSLLLLLQRCRENGTVNVWQHKTYFTLLLSTAYTTWGVSGRKRRLSAARRNAWAGGMLYKDSVSLTPLIQVKGQHKTTAANRNQAASRVIDASILLLIHRNLTRGAMVPAGL